MRLAYITRVRAGKGGAQSLQIASMAEAFRAIPGLEFTLSTGDMYPRYLIACLKAAYQILRDRRAVIFTRDIGVAVTTLLFGGRAIWEIHNAPQGNVAITLLRRAIRFDSFRCVAISGALRSYLTDHFALSPAQVITAHSGVGPCPAADISKLATELAKHPNTALHSGSLHKGGREVLAQIAHALGPDFTLVQVGGTVAEQAAWRLYLNARGVENLLFIPQLSQAESRNLQSCADLLIYLNTRESPIYWCTSPLKLFEYFSSGVPVLGSTLGSVGEILTPECGFGFDPDDPASIKTAASEFRENPNEAHRRAENALSQSRDAFSWQTRAENIAAFAFPTTTL